MRATRRNQSLQHCFVVYAKNKERVSAFYQRTLALAIEESDPAHDLLVGESREIMVHRIPRQYAASIRIARPVVPREETPIKPVFVVGSLDAVRIAAKETGGYLKPEEHAWHYRGFTVLDGWDPEGNIVQFRQPD